MAIKNTDREKYFEGLVPQSLNGNATGRYYPVGSFRRFTAVCFGGAVAAGKKMKVELLQGDSAVGGNAKAVGGTPSAEAVAGVKDVACTLTLATVVNADAITINGLVFTAHTNTTDKTKRQYSIAGADAADAAELASCINDPQYGVPGIVAQVLSGAVVTLWPAATAKGVGVTVTAPAATITVAPTQLMSIASCKLGDLDYANGFAYLACKVTTDAAILTGTLLVFAGARGNPAQAAGAEF